MHLILIETSGNQNYIFATNKLRENVGASELTYRAGTQWVLQAVANVDGPPDLWAEDPAQLRQNLCNTTKNPPLSETTKVEVIVATSGKALLLVHQRATGQAIIQQVTKTALECAPGIDVCGVIVELGEKRLSEAIRVAHEEFEAARANRPGPALRFLRLPIVAECQSSGLPAAEWDERDPNEKDARSNVSLRKRNIDTLRSYHRRIKAILKRRHQRKLLSLFSGFSKNLGVLEKQCDWLAVVHADGNGLGEIFLKFGEHAGCKQDRDYIEKLRQFSCALDVCTENAFLSALQNFLRNKEQKSQPRRKRLLPIVPIVLGGDDLTIVCDGEAALQFTHDFLQTFEVETRQTDTEHFNGIIPFIAKAALGDERLSACAGIAIIKPHFPFSAAYDLAEELIKSAKQVKKTVLSPKQNANNQPVPWPCSALDFHALYDSTVSELREIRGNKLVTDGGQTSLVARPYVITDLGSLESAATGTTWAKQHHWSELQGRVEAILRPDENDEQRRELPNSQLHDLRAGLFLGKEGANARYQLISHRYEENKLKVFEEADGDLFLTDEKGATTTKFLDAMEAANFWVKEVAQKKGENK